MTGLRVLVCGGRDFADAGWLSSTLDSLHAAEPFGVLIQGGARGADRLAEIWALARGLRVDTYPANWNRHGRAAGPLRNHRMLVEGKPDLVVAFPGGRGTDDMVRQAERAGVSVHRVAAPEVRP